MDIDVTMTYMYFNFQTTSSTQAKNVQTKPPVCLLSLVGHELDMVSIEMNPEDSKRVCNDRNTFPTKHVQDIAKSAAHYNFKSMTKV